MLAEVKTCSIFGRTDGGEDRSLLEGVVEALIARHAAPGETLILGSGDGGAPASYPFWRRRLGAHGSSYVASYLRAVVLGVVLLRSAPMYPVLGVCVCRGGVACGCTGCLWFGALYIKRGESLFR